MNYRNDPSYRFKPDVQFYVQDIYVVTEDHGKHVKAGMLLARHDEGWFVYKMDPGTFGLPSRDGTGKIPLYRDYWEFLANPNEKNGTYFHEFFDAKKRRLR